MKKAIIVLSILLGCTLIATGMLGEFLYKTIDELKSKSAIIEQKDEQIRKQKDVIVDKDKVIEQQNNTIAEKDKKIKAINKKADMEKKAANVIAENGDYESEDTTEIFESEGQPPEGTFRTLTVSSSSDKSITLSLEESESGGRRIDGFQEPVSVSLNNGSGNFKAVYGGGNYGMETVAFEGTINIVDKKTISITCNNGKGWEKGETHSFKKK